MKKTIRLLDGAGNSAGKEKERDSENEGGLGGGRKKSSPSNRSEQRSFFFLVSVRWKEGKGRSITRTLRPE